MRILYLSHYALPHIGGIEIVVDQLARGAASRGHEVVHVASAERGGVAGEAGDAPYRVVRVASWSPAKRRGVPYPFFSPALRGIVSREAASADVVHAHGFLYQPSMIGFAAAKRRGVPRVLTEHVGFVASRSRVTNAVQRMAIATAGRRVARAADAIIVLNADVERQMRALAPGARIVTMVNGVDIARYRPPQPGERERLRAELGWDAAPRALLAGRMVEKKGIGLAVAAARAGGGRFSLVLAGEGDAPPPSPHVEVLGPVSRDRLAEIYRAADVLLLPSYGEGFPLVAQEAMASGLPVILRASPAYAPILAGCGAAVQLVPPDADAIVAAVEAMLAARERAARDAVEFARERFRWDEVVERHLRLYEEVGARDEGRRTSEQTTRPSSLAPRP